MDKGQSPEPRVALVHDWLTGMRGGEKVLDAICELYPDAPLYTLVHVRGTVSTRIESRRIRTSIVQRLPRAGRLYRHYLPLYPTTVEWCDLDQYDLVISTSHCAVKSVVRPGRAVHVSYCHSPMRYAWDQFEEYFGPARVGVLQHQLLRPVIAAIARWDAATAGRVDGFVANSRYVAGRIRRYYNRGSTVVYPPVDTDFYRPSADARSSGSGFLVVSALVPYKRLDVAVEACQRLGAPLQIVGTGPERARLQALGHGNVEFLGWRSDDEIRELYRRSRAVLLPGVEDFGLVPVEAQACGCPVVAFGVGGVTETVVDGETGVLVEGRSVEAFADGLARVQRQTFDSGTLHEHTRRFSRQRFLAEFQVAVTNAINHRLMSPPSAGREEGQAAARRTPSPPSAGRENKQ
jgi:glycosyltransferase involved in cell wall biosynthesis